MNACDTKKNNVPTLLYKMTILSLRIHFEILKFGFNFYKCSYIKHLFYLYGCDLLP